MSTAYRSIQKARVGFHTRFIFIPFYCPQPGPGCTAAAYSYKTCPANTQTTRFKSCLLYTSNIADAIGVDAYKLLMFH